MSEPKCNKQCGCDSKQREFTVKVNITVEAESSDEALDAVTEILARKDVPILDWEVEGCDE